MRSVKTSTLDETTLSLRQADLIGGMAESLRRMIQDFCSKLIWETAWVQIPLPSTFLQFVFYLCLCRISEDKLCYLLLSCMFWVIWAIMVCQGVGVRLERRCQVCEYGIKANWLVSLIASLQWVNLIRGKSISGVAMIAIRHLTLLSFTHCQFTQSSFFHSAGPKFKASPCREEHQQQQLTRLGPRGYYYRLEWMNRLIDWMPI